MCIRLLMLMEPQPLHAGMVCSTAVTQAFIRLSKSGSTRVMVTGCRGSICPSTAYEVVQTPYMCSTFMCMQLWMGMEPQTLHNGMICSPADTQAFRRPSKSGSSRAMVTNCPWFHMPIHYIWSGSNTLYVLHIDMHASLDGYGASTTA